jgi:hypothetical protein
MIGPLLYLGLIHALNDLTPNALIFCMPCSKI